MKPSDPRLQENADELATIRRLRAELIATSNLDSRHSEIISELDAVSSGLYERLAQGFARLNTDVKTSQPFHWAVEFPEAFVGEDGQPLDNPGFHFIFGNPPYGAALSAAERSWLRREYKIGMTNSAGLFMAQSLRLLRDGGAHGFIVPKSFLYASNWRKLREKLLDGLETLADCGRAWQEVLLEQVIYVHRKDAPSSSYRNLVREGEEFRLVGDIDKEVSRHFGCLANDVNENEVRIARQMLSTGQSLHDHVQISSGGDMQNRLTPMPGGRPVIGGAEVQRYYLRGTKGRLHTDDFPRKSNVKEGSIIVQDILAFIENPMKHIKITAHLIQSGETDRLILNTLNKIEISSGNLEPELALALLNSKLINWYVYRFLFCKPIRTMHFNRPIISRIPLPDLEINRGTCKAIVAEIARIYDNRHANEESAQAKIDDFIFQLYGLSDEQIALVEANMP